MENCEATNLEFEFKRHKNKSKLRETELLEALSEKEKEISKLERSLNVITAERLQNSKEELLKTSLNENSEADVDGNVCVKCEDLQRLLEENKKVTSEFEKLTLEYEKLKLSFEEIEKDNVTYKIKIEQLEKLQAQEKAECENLLLEVQNLREKLQNIQRNNEELNSENTSKKEECINLTRQVEVAREEMVVLEKKFTKLELSWQEQQQTVSDIEEQYASVQLKYEQLQNKYEQLETTTGQSQTECQRLEKENDELQSAIDELKHKVQHAQQKLLDSNEKYEESAKESKTANEEFSLETSKLQKENDLLKQQLKEIEAQFEDLQKENVDLSNQIMDNLQDCESLKQENSTLLEKLKEYGEKTEEVSKTEAQLHELKLQLEKVLSGERSGHLKTPSSGRNTSMLSSGVCVENECEEYFTDYLSDQDLLNKFCELSESLTEIELEHTNGKTRVFRSASKNSTPNYKMYLKNIKGVRKTQKEFDMEIENIHLQGSFNQHSFHIVELSGENISAEFEYDTINRNGCENMPQYIEKLKQKIIELQTQIEQERLSSKSLLESTEKACIEMKEQITQLSAELLEKSMFVENCSCKTYQQQIETLEKEKINMTIICDELQEKINCTLNGSINMEEERLKELEQLKQREQELLESLDSQTKTLEELTHRNLDMESDLEAAREQLEKQEQEHKEQYSQLQLEILQKLELSANEHRDNMKKYNKEWEEQKDKYEQTIKDLQQQVEELKKLSSQIAGDLKQEIKNETLCESEENTIVLKAKYGVSEEISDNVKKENVEMPQDIELIKDCKSRLEEENNTLQKQLNALEEQLEHAKEENRTQYEEIKLLDSKNVALEEHLTDSQVLHSTLMRDYTSLETQINDLNEDLNCLPELHDKNQRLTNEIEKINKEYLEVQEKLRKAEEQIEEFNKDTSEDNNKEINKTLPDKLKHMSTNLEEENRALANELKNLQLEYSVLQEQLQKAKVEIKAHSQNDSKREELLQNLEKHVMQLTALEEEKNNLTIELNNLKDEFLVTQEKLLMAEGQIEELNNTEANRKVLIETLQAKLTHISADLEEEKKSLVSELKNVKLENSDLQEKLQDLQVDVTKRKELIQTLQAQVMQVAVLEEEKKNLTNEFQNLKEQYSLLQQKLHKSEEKIIELISEDTNRGNLMLSQLQAVEEEKKIIENERNQLKQREDKSSKEINSLKEELSTLNENLAELNACRTELLLEKTAFKNKLQKITNEYNLLKTDEVLLQNQVSELNKENESLNKQCVMSQEEINALNEQLKCLKEKEKAEEMLEQMIKEKAEIVQNLHLTTEKLESAQRRLQQKEEDHLALQKSFKESLSEATEEKHQQLEKLKNDYETALQQNHEFEKQLQKMQSALNCCDKGTQQIQHELKVTKEALTEIQQEKQTLQEKVLDYQKLQEDKNKLESTIKILKSEQFRAFKTLQEDRNHLHTTLEEYKEQSKLFKEKEETLNLKIESLSQQLHETRGKVVTYQKVFEENTEVENALSAATAINEKLQQQIEQLIAQEEDHKSNMASLSSEIEKLNLQLDSQLNEKQTLQTKLSHLKMQLQGEQSSMQRDNHELKNSLEELKMKCESLQMTNTKLESLNEQLMKQSQGALEKLKEFYNLQEEHNILKMQHSELQLKIKETEEEAGRSSLALRKDIENQKQLLQKHLNSHNELKLEMESKQKCLTEENLKLNTIIETLRKEKHSLKEKLGEIVVRNFEHELQRQVIEATSNTSIDSNTSFSPKGHKSLDRMSGGPEDFKVANFSMEKKLSGNQQKNLTTAERKNRRLSTHDERRRQSYWGVAHDKGTMTDPTDTSCNCVELDRKLKECERELFIKISQVTGLTMQLKNHPLKDENAALVKRLQEEQDRHRTEIKRYKSKLYEQTVKTEKAIAMAAQATDKAEHTSSNAALLVEQQSIKVLTDVQTQTEDELSVLIQKLQGKYNDLKNICRARYNVIKELEEKIAQKENSDGNSLSGLDAVGVRFLKNQCESLRTELSSVKEKYENAKKVLYSRREEIGKLRAQLEKPQ